MLVFLSLLFGSVRSQSGECDVGWTSHSNGYCYKFFDTPKDLADFTGIRLRCQTLGGDIATGAIRSERDLMYRLAQPFSQPDTVKNARVMAGIIWLKNGSWVSMDPTETVEIDRNFWCPGDPNYVGKETCTHFLPGRSCMWSYYCTFMRRNYICRKPQLTCKNENTIAKEGKCVCKEGYVDIRETDDLDKNKYKEGEKCVPKDPCNSLRQSFSLIFIVDASQSIQERNWPSLVDFVKSAANLLPNQVNVGFIKFSTKVSFAEWLPTKWSRREFEQMVPEDFDAGYTNTPAAIEKAIEMFDEDRRQTDKVAVLITDGLPVIDEQTDKDKGLTDTRAAISKLQRRGVDIVALGFGPELRQQRGDTYIKKWLSDPEEDYFSFDRMACDLRKVHMQMLLQKIHTYARPITFVPLPISAVTGVFRHFMPAHYLLPIGGLLQIINCTTIMQLFAYRYWTVAKLSASARKFNNFHKSLIIAEYSFAAATFVLLEYVNHENSRATDELILAYTCVKELTAFPIELYGYDEELVKTYYLLPLSINLAIIFSIFGYFLITNYRVIDARNMSPQLRRLHRNYINQLICQALIPSFIVFLPVSYVIIAVYNDIQGHEFLANLPLLSVSTFSIIDSSVVIAMNKNYHTWFTRIFKEYRKQQSPTVLSLHKKVNQMHHK